MVYKAHVLGEITYITVQRKGGLSTHEKQLEKLRAEIEQMEKANLEPKAWTMQGEVILLSMQYFRNLLL